MKQRITLVVLAVLFVVAGSLAQSKTIGLPLSQNQTKVFAAQTGKNVKQLPKKELQMQQSKGKQKGFRSNVLSHAKQVGKKLTKKHRPAALRRAAADIIYEQPEGTKTVYSRNGYAYASSWLGTYPTEVSAAVGAVVFGADNKVYFKNLISQLGINTWVVGLVSGNKITISLPQTVYDSGEGYCCEVAKMTYKNKGYVRAANQTVTLNYDATTGAISTLKGSDLESGDEIIGLSYDDDLTWAGYGDWNISFEKVTDALVEAPAGLTTETYSLVANGYFGSLVNVGFDGNDVYVQGIDKNLPENWVKGTINGNKVTFKNGQYVGADEVANSHQYLCSAIGEEKYDDYYEEFYTEYTLGDADITFDYNATTKTLSDGSLFLLNAGKTDVDYLVAFDKAVLAPFTEVAVTPAAPEVTLTELGYEYYDSGYGWGSIDFALKTSDVNGNYTLPEKTSYKLWVKVNGEEKPLKLSWYDYQYQEEEIMDEIPFDYSDDWDIGNAGTDKYVYYYVVGPEAYGVQTIYRGGGEERVSEISWVNVEGIGADIQPAAATPVYPEATISDTDNKINYGFYTGSEEVLSTTNNSKPETYDVAVKFNNPALVGTKIESITFPLQEVEGISDISVFLTSQLRVENGKNAADLVVKSVTPAEPGFITVKLDKPYTIPEGGVYVGYSLTVNDVDNVMANAEPINIMDQYTEGGYYLHTSDGVLKWLDFGEFLGGSSLIQIKVAGSNIMANAATIAQDEAQYVKTGETITVPVTVTNHGAKGIQSFDVAYTVAGQNGTQHFDAAVDAFFGKSTKVELNIPAITEKGNYELEVKIDKVNAAVNEDVNNGTTIPVMALNSIPKKRTLLEEYTGFWCGWCPRGYVALEKLAELYPDDYVLVSYHNDDNLEIMVSDDFPSDVLGFPDAWMDRAVELDAYYGTGYNDFDIAVDLAASNKQFGYADINIVPTIGDNLSTINIDAEVVFPFNLNDGNFTVEYILTSDGLTKESWGQSNYYANASNGYPLYMDQFSKTENSTIYGLVYNNVAVLTSEILGGSKNHITTAAADVPVKLSYSFSVDDAVNTSNAPVIQKMQNLKVVALLIDATTGKVVNANVAKLDDSMGISMIEVGDRANSSATYFDLQGRRVAMPAKGLYINNGRKVIVK